MWRHPKRRDSCPQACHVQIGESACLLTCSSYTIDCPVPRKAQVREDFVRPAPGASVNSDGRKEGGVASRHTGGKEQGHREESGGITPGKLG